ncbi:hypothetical protein AAVH_27509, partial [Aphelenchoides avenae]
MIDNDSLVDIFSCLARSNLDALQLVSARFSGIIAVHINSVCHRLLVSARIDHDKVADRCNVLVTLPVSFMDVILPRGPGDKSGAFEALLRACRCSKVTRLSLFEADSIDSKALEDILRHGPCIQVNELSVGRIDLTPNVTPERVLEALSSFAALRQIWFAPNENSARMQNFLLRNAFRIGVSLCTLGVDNCSVDEESLMHFSFGPCADNCGACDRHLVLRLTSRSPLFLTRWIEEAENTACTHRLRLRLRSKESQDTSGVSKHLKTTQDSRQKTYRSVKGRTWKA